MVLGEQQERQKALMAKAQRRMAREDEAIRQTFSTPQGKQTYLMLKSLFFNKSVYSRGDSHHTSYLSGQQDVVGLLVEVMEGRNVDFS